MPAPRGRRCGLCFERGHDRRRCPKRAVLALVPPAPAAEEEPPLDLALIEPDPLPAPRRLRFLCAVGVVEMMELDHDVVYWRLQGLHGHYWRGPCDSRMEATGVVADLCRISWRRADFRLISRRPPGMRR